MYLEKKVAMADLPLEAAKRVQFSIKKGDKGNMLVFLSGQAQIKQAQEALQEMMTKGEIDPNEFVVAPYLGSMSREEQNATFAKFGGKRVIVLATNAAHGLQMPAFLLSRKYHK